MNRAAYLVVRPAVDREGGACEDQFGYDTGSCVPVRLFSTRAAADAFAEQLAAEARRTMNPFPLLDGYLSDELMKRLAEFGFPVACPDESWHADWARWWELCSDRATDEQRVAVRALFGQTFPYEVVETEVRDE